MVGIHRIKNIINEKCYYGSSKNIEKRWLRHKSDLINKKHHNVLLQKSWEKYGEDNFIFEVVEFCNTSDLLVVEQKMVYGIKKIGKKVYSNNKPFIIDGILYRTLKDASELLSINIMTIKGRIKSKRPEFSNYNYVSI